MIYFGIRRVLMSLARIIKQFDTKQITDPTAYEASNGDQFGINGIALSSQICKRLNAIFYQLNRAKLTTHVVIQYHPRHAVQLEHKVATPCF